MVHSNQIID